MNTLLAFPLHPGRRRWLHRLLLSASAAALAGSPFPSRAETWPSRPVHLVTTATPGGPVDILARLTADQLASALGQSVLVENKSGAAGYIGAQAVLHEPADGYTWLVTVDGTFTESPHATAAPFDPLNDLRPVAELGFNGLVLAVNADIPAKTLPEFINWAKTQGGEIHYSSWGLGSAAQLRSLQLEKAAGLQLNHVPYRGNVDALQAVAGGQTSMMFSGLVNATPLYQAGKIRLLGFTGEERSPYLPEVPTFKEQGFPTVVGETWIGIWARADMPAPQRDRMHQEVTHALATPAVHQRIQALNTNPGRDRTPGELAQQLAADHAAVGKLLRAEGFSPQ